MNRMFRLPRRVVLLSLLAWVLALGTLAYAADLAFAPANYGYTYNAQRTKPVCTSASHVLAGWTWWRSPSGTSTVAATLVCTSSQSATNTGWAWRAMTTGTATVP